MGDNEAEYIVDLEDGMHPALLRRSPFCTTSTSSVRGLCRSLEKRLITILYSFVYSCFRDYKDGEEGELNFFEELACLFLLG